MIDFNNISKRWALCSGNGCPRAAECLRHLAYSQAPADVSQWLCVVHTATADTPCSYYQKAEKKRMAVGMSRIFSGICSRHLRHRLRVKISEYLGSKGTYHRYKQGQKMLNPEQQQWIQDLIHGAGVEEEVVFDAYVDTYDFQG